IPAARVVAGPPGCHVGVAGALQDLRPGGTAVHRLQHDRLSQTIGAGGICDTDIGTAHRDKKRMIASDTIRYDSPHSRTAIESVNRMVISIIRSLYTGIYIP